MHKADSIYEDEPDVVYDFPRAYLKAVQEAVGDWILYYEPVKAGPRGYFAVAKISQVIEKPKVAGRYLALIEPGSFLPFDTPVPRLENGTPFETTLAEADGTPKKGGAVQLAVRRLPEVDFARIVNRGLPQDLIAMEASRYGATADEFASGAETFERPVLERLVQRPYREVAFRRKVREAYGYRCAMSGLMLRNGGGRPEVQAAHIRPVQDQGSDSVRNGFALSGTLHWMFDRGLLSVADDCQTILVSHNKVSGDVIDRLLPADRKLILPLDPNDRPHPRNLQWHRENVFGRVLNDEAPTWDG
ncbi:HNH endonuclease [Pararhodobacter sp. CCB-MM2]|uniref:HNH endonuclease n=1 Tax=Pararhodobacter sp. CCB-MM2 TaxID=1786003 RepID=UPI001F401F0F|nr:HNH endonuclease [Pararhodobacter sp. CCB-MM2]